MFFRKGISLFWVALCLFSNHAYASSEGDYLKALTEVRVAGDAATRILDILAQARRSDAFQNAQALDAIQDFQQYSAPIKEIIPNYVSLQDIYTGESIIAQFKDAEISRFRKIEEISRGIADAGLVLDLVGLSQDSYDFVVNVRSAFDTSNPTSVKIKDGLQASLNLRGAYEATLSIADLLKTRMNANQAFTFWTNNSFAKGYNKVLGPKSLAGGPLQVLELGAQIESYVYTHFRDSNINEIKNNVFGTRVFDTRLKQALLTNLVDAYLEAERNGRFLGFGELSQIFAIKSSLDVVYGSFREGESIRLTEEFADLANSANYLNTNYGVADFSSLNNEQRLFVALRALAVMSFYEDSELKGYLETVIGGKPAVADIIFGSIRSDIYDIYSTDSLFQKLFPYLNRMPAFDFYESLFRLSANGEIARFQLDKQATLGEAIDEINRDGSYECESFNVCNTLPIITGVTATDGAFSSSVRISWDHEPTAEIYNVFRCENTIDDDCDYLASTNSPITLFDDFSVNVGQFYFYRVQGCDDSACSEQLSNADTGSAFAPSDSMLHVSDTVPDGTFFQQGSTFTQNWTVQNNGGTVWDSSYCLKHRSGALLGNVSSRCVIGTVEPGERYIFSVPMTAPQATPEDQTYRDNWTLHKNNFSFSGNIWTEIVVSGVTPTGNVPSNFTAEAVNASSISLNWSASGTGADYRLYRANSPGDEFIFARQIGSLNYVDKQLEPSTSYYYKLRRCASGIEESCSDFSTTQSATTLAAAQPSSLISDFSVNGSGVTGTNITMTATASNGGGIADRDRFKFVFALSTDEILGVGDVVLLKVAESGNFTLSVGESDTYSRSYVIPDNAALGSINLIACMLYTDLNDTNQQYCEARLITIIDEPVSIPSTPSSPSISYQQGQDQIAIAWNSSSGGDYYRLEKSTSASGGFNEIFGGTGFSYVDTSVNDGTTYFYRLRSCQNSLSSSCSNFSSNSSVTTLSTATNDFIAQNIKVSRPNNQLRVEAGHRYVGSSVSLVRPKMGFFLSQDTVCSASSDLFLGEQSSGLNVNDTIDVEDITVPYPSEANTGTWYACAIADYTSEFAETNENNNAVSITARTEVSPPRFFPQQSLGPAYLEIEWDAVPGNVSYRLARSTSIDGPFNSYPYIGTGRSFTDTGLSHCTEYFYQLKSCNGTNSNALCSVAPVVNTFTIPSTTQAPMVEALSPNKVKVSWENQDCATFYAVDREREDGRDDYVYAGSDDSFVDSLVFPGTVSKYRMLACPRNTSDLGRICAYISPFVEVTTPSEKTVDPEWETHGSPDGPGARVSAERIVFNNKTWTIAGSLDGVFKSDVWSSVDGIEWVLETEAPGFSPRTSAYTAVHNSRLYLIGGRDENLNYLTDVWSTADGVTWRQETASAGFPLRSGGGQAYSFNNKLWIGGGFGRLPDNSPSPEGYRSDLWSSVDGVSWSQVTSNAAYGSRGFHRVIAHSGKLYLYGGELNSGGSGPSVAGADIWSSDDGVTWVKVKDDLPYGHRGRFGLLQFGGKFWLLGGREQGPYSFRRDNSVDRMVPRYQGIFEDDIWVSDNGLDWSLYNEVGPWAPNGTYEALVFNNRVWQINTGPETRSSSNFGYSVLQPQGALQLSGEAFTGNEISADLGDIQLSIEESGVTYNWFRNGELVEAEKFSSLSLVNAVIGDIYSVEVIYTSPANEMYRFTSNEITVQVNPISAEFEIESLISKVDASPVSNTIINWLSSYDVIYQSEDPSIVTVDGTDENLNVIPVGVGSTTITAQITDSATNAQKTLSFTVVIDKGINPLSFPASILSVAEGSPVFVLEPSESGSGGGQLSFSSSNESVASISVVGGVAQVTVNSIGETVLIAVKASDDQYESAVASITLRVFNGDADTDGVPDEFDNCVADPNPGQENRDNDRLGDVCDPDDDGDTVVDLLDCAPIDVQKWLNRNGYVDTDLDGIGAGLSITICAGQVVPAPYVEIGNDNCPNIANAGQANFDGDTQGDACDANDDNDVFDDILDCADRDDTRWQLLDGYLDVDEDGVGFGIIDQVCSGTILPVDYATRTDDNCQFDANADQLNSDDDALGNVCDADDDNDEILDEDDNCRLVANNDQADDDGDGIGNACMTENDSGSLCFPVLTTNGSVAMICL